jgi:hypothetical protein
VKTVFRIKRTVPAAAAALGILVLLAAPRTHAQQIGQSGLTWQQRYLGILPLVKPNPKDPVMVTVNGAPITVDQVRDYAKTEQRMLNATTELELKKTVSDATQSLINRELLLQEAHRRHITVPAAEVAERARQFEIQGLSGQTLSSGGAPDRVLLDQVRGSMEIEKMLDAEFRAHDVAPTAKEIRQYYEQHKDLFVQDPGEVRLSHIAVKLPPNPTRAQKEAAWKKINQLRREAEKGKDFAALARKYSEDPASAAKGGDLGYFRKGELPPVVDKIAFSTRLGHLSPIIESNLGFSFFKVTARRGQTYAPFNAVKSQIALALLQYNQERVVRNLVKNLARKAHIRFQRLPNAPA